MVSKNDAILIISHFTYRVEMVNDIGPPQDLKNFLLKEVKKIIYIELPFPYANDKKCYISIYENGTLVEAKKTFPLFGPDWFQYMIHPIIILYFSVRSSPHTICFALDNLSTISVLPLRFLKLIKRLVYYSIDYTPHRFQNRVLNFLYQIADKIACATVDINWVLSKPMLHAKKTRKFFIGEKAIFYEVPMGFPKKEITLLPIEKIDRFHLVFVGVLLEKQGVQIVLESLPILIQYFPKIHLTIIGTGNYEDELKKIASKFKINRSVVTFKGFIKDHRQIEAILTHGGIGLAPYKPSPESFTYFADPLKPKLYLGCGLPVIITNVPPIAKVIKKNKAGLIMNYSKESFIKSAQGILKDFNTYANFRRAAVVLSEEYDTEKILKTAISQIL